MTLDEFTVLTEAWGADIARWPEHLRASAAALAREPEAMSILAKAEQIDQLIIGARPKVLTDRVDRAIFDVMARLAADGRRANLDRALLWPRWLIPAASFACAAILGMSLGLVKPLNALRSSADTAMLTMILDKESFGLDWVLR